MSEKRKMDEGEQTPPGKKAKAVAAAQNGKATVVNGDGEIVRSQEYMLQAQRLEMMRSSQQSRMQALYDPLTVYTPPSTEQDESYRDASAFGIVDVQSRKGLQPSQLQPVKQAQQTKKQEQQDPLIYSGVYAPSGFNIMDILVRIYQRPNPQIPLGSIDHSVALTLCDGTDPSLPIIYCSDPFLQLTHYAHQEVIGRNCRFLQYPPPSSNTKISVKDLKANEAARSELKQKMSKGEEARVKLVNFTREGGRFENVLTVVPLVLEGGRSVVVGFQADAGKVFA